MRILMLIFTLFISTMSYAQVTKQQILDNFKAVNLTLDDIEGTYVENTRTYSKDGTNVISSEYSLKSDGNSLELTKTGINIIYSKDGEALGIQFLPYDKIQYIRTYKKVLTISLMM